jgi:hypothetical protein
VVNLALVFQNLLGTLPLFVGEIANHLDNSLFNLGHDLFVGLIRRLLNIEYGASHIMIQAGQPLHFKFP